MSDERRHGPLSRLEIESWAAAFIDASALEPSPTSGHPLWWAIERAIFVTREADAESFWLFILEVVSRNPPPKVIASMAAGPLEDLIFHAGESFIDRIETEARRSPAFRRALGGVWRSGTAAGIWARVQRARGGF